MVRGGVEGTRDVQWAAGLAVRRSPAPDVWLPASGLADKTAEPGVKLQKVGCWLVFKFDASLSLDAVAWAP